MSDSVDIKKRKLTLNRETLTVMTADELTNVNGGTWSQVVKWSIKSVRWASEAFGISTAVKETVDMTKGGGGPQKGNDPAPPKLPPIAQSRYYKTPGGCAD